MSHTAIEKVRNFYRRWYGILATVLVAVLASLIFFLGSFTLPAPVEMYSLVQTNQKWTDQERQWFYHTSQGSEVMPVEWFLALEQPDSRNPFLASDYMSRFRFVPDPNPMNNEARLPVGFARDDPDPVTGIQNLGLSCALCHTALITYRGMGIRVDGAPGKFNFDLFLTRLITAVAVVAAPAPVQLVLAPGKFDRFAHRVLGAQYTPQAADKLRSERADLAEGEGRRTIGGNVAKLEKA